MRLVLFWRVWYLGISMATIRRRNESIGQHSITFKQQKTFTSGRPHSILSAVFAFVACIVCCSLGSGTRWVEHDLSMYFDLLCINYRRKTIIQGMIPHVYGVRDMTGRVGDQKARGKSAGDVDRRIPIPRRMIGVTCLPPTG